MPYSQKWIETNPEQFRIARNGRVHRYRGTTKGKYYAGRFTARKRGIEFSITMDEFAALVRDDQCHWCAGPLPLLRPGLDRLDNAIGYVAGNCVACCWICNVMKGTMSAQDFVERCRKIVEIADGR